jgi:Trypsin-like peptidase domain/von Willebrand factor type A domain
MSHRTGTVQTLAPALTIGPDSGPPTTPPNTWSVSFAHVPAPAPGGTKLVILHFQNVNLPGANRLEVDLGYGTDVFTAADGAAFWTRPVNIYKLAGGLVPIRYIAAGAAAGSAQLDRYGRGEQLPATEPGHNSITNSDPFLKDQHYTEPKYDDFWICTAPPKWENIACVAVPADVRARVGRSVGMILSPEGNDLSTCSVTLVDADKVVTAGHCHQPSEALASSVTFDYRLECNGDRPVPYDARFYKVAEVLAHHNDAIGDFSLLRLAEAPTGIPAIQMRHDVPVAPEAVFGVHHPNGAPKKLSVPHPGFTTVSASDASRINVPSGFDVAGGSSGSGLFDTAGRIVGVLSNGDACGRFGPASPLRYFPTASILKAIAPAPPPAVTRDVMVVFDRSGSMSELDHSGRVKIEAARDAVSLFVKLVRSAVGNRVGLVSFSTAASSPVDFAIQPVDDPHKQTLIGGPPFSGGIVGTLSPGGATSIGEGLNAAHLQFPAPSANPRSIMLLTDGMQNTPRFVNQVEGALGGIDVQAIGFGSDANLDSGLLAALAAAHNGNYTRAESGLALEKFFSHAFGNIFETGVLSDPEHDLPANQPTGTPHPFNVCGEDTITIVIGWDNVDADLLPRVTTPGGAIITDASAGVQQHAGRTWNFIRIPLPQGVERDGTWTATAQRPDGGGEFPPPTPALRYFINVIASGGPRLLSATDNRRYYTGDFINPLVMLRYDDGSWPREASVELTIRRPTASLGCLLAREGLHNPTAANGDTIPARQATIAALQQAAAGPLIPHTTETITLGDDSGSTRGTFEASAVFGTPLADLLAAEGHYELHYKSSYGGPGCNAQRELLSTLHVDVGIDPDHTEIAVNQTGTRPDGRHTGTITMTPGDRYGNCVGPGRPHDISISGTPGTTVTGAPQDNGDGSYTITGTWTPMVGPGLVIGQPGRPPTTVWPAATTRCRLWRWLSFLLLLLLIVLVVLLLIVLFA